MTSKQELISIMETAEHNRQIFMNLENEFANLNEKYPYEPEKK